jgi:hypothetical protein
VLIGRGTLRWCEWGDLFTKDISEDERGLLRTTMRGLLRTTSRGEGVGVKNNL